jgi:hypothetical protein
MPWLVVKASIPKLGGSSNGGYKGLKQTIQAGLCNGYLEMYVEMRKPDERRWERR